MPQISQMINNQHFKFCEICVYLTAVRKQAELLYFHSFNLS